jgi:TatA/E family protein of Tat protein translocase
MSIGPAEIIVVLVIALLVFGPGRLPQMGRSLGRGVREFKKAADTAKEELGLSEVLDSVNEVKDDIMSSAGINEIKESIAGVTSTIDDAKASMGVEEITAGVGTVKTALAFNPKTALAFDPKKAAKGLVTGKSRPAATAETAASGPGDGDAPAGADAPAAEVVAAGDETAAAAEDAGDGLVGSGHPVAAEV